MALRLAAPETAKRLTPAPGPGRAGDAVCSAAVQRRLAAPSPLGRVRRGPRALQAADAVARRRARRRPWAAIRRKRMLQSRHGGPAQP